MSSESVTNKKKRPHAVSNEASSFVANVASKVSSLLPSTFTKWFINSGTAEGNGAVRNAESEESSTDDEVLDSTTVIPAKRMRLNTDHYNHIEPANNNCSTNNFNVTETATSHPSDSDSFKLIKLDNSKNEDVTNETKEPDLPRLRNLHSMFNTGYSVAAIRKSIFDVKNKVNKETTEKDKEEKSTSVTETKPYFKLSPGSTFYPGRTMYGGASYAHMTQAATKHHLVAKVNKALGNEDSAMSSSARRVMDLLECYSSPIREAKRLPPYARPRNRTQELYIAREASIMRLKQKSRLMGTTHAARQIIASHSSSTNNESSKFPYLLPAITEETNTIDEDDTNKNSAPPEEKNSDELNTIETVKRSQRNNKNNKNTLKMKTKVTQTNREKIDSVNTEMETPLKLPSVVLKIDQNKLPKFTLITDDKLLVTSTPKAELPVAKVSEAKNVSRTTETITTNYPKSMFIFSEPIKISCDNLNEETTPQLFTFDNPEQNISKNYAKECVPMESDIKNDNLIDNTLKYKSLKYNWFCQNCLAPNEAEDTKCVSCANNNVKPSKCTSCKLADSQVNNDLCVNCEKMKSNKSQVLEKSTKWKCEGCWVMNDASANKCVCCNATIPSDESKAAKVRDLEEILKATAPKPGDFILHGSKPQLMPTKPDGFCSTNTDNGTLVDIAKSQKSNKWECSSCLVMNESNKTTCVCCGTEKENISKLPEAKFNFGTNTATIFKFGIDPKLQEAKIKTKTTEITEDKLKGESESNNIVAKSSAFIFSIPTNKEERKDDLLQKAKVDIKFNFGVSNSIKSEQPKQTEDKKKPQEVPQTQFNFGEPVKPLGQLFTPPLTKPSQNDGESVSAPVLPSSQTVEDETDTTSNSILEQVPTTVEKTQTITPFFFGKSPIRIASNLFSVPSTVTVGSSDTTTAHQTVTTITSTSTMLTMPTIAQQKSESAKSVTPPVKNPILGTSMFSFVENTTSTTSLPSTTVSSIITTSDKPTFQFPFSDSKTEAAPSLLGGSSNLALTFNFGSRDETVKDTNTFRFNTGTPVVTSNAIPSLGPNSLAGNNGLATNSLTPNNTLAANNGIVGSGNLTGIERSDTLGSNNLIGIPLGNQTLSSNSLGNSLPNINLSGNSLAGNTLAGNMLPSNLFGTNNLTTATTVTTAPTLGINGGLPGNTLTGGNVLQQNSTLNNNASRTPNIFGDTVKNDNMWNANNNTSTNNLFVENKSVENTQKPPAFTFGTPGPFNMNSSAPMPFGNNTQPSQNIFGIGNQNNKPQSSLFPTSIPNQTTTPMFGSPQPATNPTPQMNMFGSQNISSVPPFGSTNTTISSFETPSMTTVPRPAFNFGSSTQSPGFFGFGQQQAQSQAQQPGVYSFGSGAAAGAPQVQFAMGTSPNTTGRRLRKAVRRNTPR